MSRLAALLYLLLLPLTCLAQSQKQLNLLLIVVDTLGAKHTTLFNPQLAHTPVMAGLAAEGAHFRRAVSAAPWTKPSVASIFTGLYPSRHGVIGLRGVLSDKQKTLAEMLKAAGYQTAGFISHTLIEPRYGYGQGFDRYEVVPLGAKVHQAISSPQVTAASLDWLENRDRSKPFFLFAHFFDPHYNYRDHREFDFAQSSGGRVTEGLDFGKLRRLFPKLGEQERQFIVSLYHEEVAFVDMHIGKLLEYLERAGLARETLVVLTADHGEEFGEHGKIGHTHSLFNELIHVPLIIRLPGTVPPGAREDMASHVDILPSVLDLLRQEKLATEGVSLFSTPQPSGNSGSRIVMSEVHYKAGKASYWLTAAMSKSHKAIYDHNSKRTALYDMQLDFNENSPLAQPHQIEEALQRYLQSRGSDAPSSHEVTPESQPSSDEIQALKSLGYL